MTKNRIRAFAMATIFVVVSAAVSYTIRKLVFLHYFGNEDVRGSLSGAISIFSLEAHGGWLSAVVINLLTIGVISLWVSTLDKTHFKHRGVFRWALMGIVYALIEFIISTVVVPYTVFIVGSIASNFVPFLAFGLSYGFVFKVCWIELKNRISTGYNLRSHE